jgi:hypothetical protein
MQQMQAGMGLPPGFKLPPAGFGVNGAEGVEEVSYTSFASQANAVPVKPATLCQPCDFRQSGAHQLFCPRTLFHVFHTLKTRPIPDLATFPSTTVPQALVAAGGAAPHIHSQERAGPGVPVQPYTWTRICYDCTSPSPLRDIVVFPGMVVPLFVGREKSVAALEAAMEGDKDIFLLAQLDPGCDDPERDDLYDVGVIAQVLQLLKLPDGTVRVLVEGRPRAARSCARRRWCWWPRSR